jgi:NTP pyrophosphatase (non-canonical NTP hydrolase)
MADETMTIAQLRQAMQAFVDERDWRKFHTPKNLAMSLAIEAAEVMEHFQWLETADAIDYAADPARREAVADEIADVCCYLLSLVNALEFDLSEAVLSKLVKNARKYPAEQFRGRSK